LTFLLDGREMTALPGETLIEICGSRGHRIRGFCYKEGMDAVGNLPLLHG